MSVLLHTCPVVTVRMRADFRLNFREYVFLFIVLILLHNCMVHTLYSLLATYMYMFTQYIPLLHTGPVRPSTLQKQHSGHASSNGNNNSSGRSGNRALATIMHDTFVAPKYTDG